MIDTAGLQRVVNADPVSGLVTIEGGAKLHALGPQLANLEKLSNVDHPQLNVPIAVKPVDCRVDRRPIGIRRHSGAVSDVIRELGRRLRAGGGCQQQPRCEDRQEYTEQANNAHAGNLAVNLWWGGRGSNPRPTDSQASDLATSQ